MLSIWTLGKCALLTVYSDRRAHAVRTLLTDAVICPGDVIAQTPLMLPRAHDV